MTEKKHHILLIEDDLNLSYLLSQNLISCGYQLVVCNSGNEALQMIYDQEFDLYILDLMLPDINGFELAKRIKKTKPNKPFIFLTAVKTDQEKFIGYELGAEDYITKPFTFKELEFKIQVVLRRFESKQERTNIIQKADLSFDIKTRKVCIDDEVFKLTKREADLLKIFFDCFNEYINRTQILNLLWDRDDIYTSRSMDVYITRLRKIISKSKFLRIENLYGEGYRLVEIQ